MSDVLLPAVVKARVGVWVGRPGRTTMRFVRFLISALTNPSLLGHFLPLV